MAPIEESLCIEKHRSICESIDLHEKNVQNQLMAMDKALHLNAVEMERRLEVLNELRKEVISDRGQFIKIDVFAARMEKYDIEVDMLSQRITVIETRLITWAAAISFFVLLITIAMQYFGK